MGIVDRIEAEAKDALKARSMERVGVLRLLRSAFTNESIANRAPLTDEQAFVVLQREAKKRREAATLYRQGGRAELADREDAERVIIDSYLPAQLSADDIQQRIDALFAADPALRDPAKVGQVMKALMGSLRGQADGKLVQELVRTSLMPDA